MSRLPAPFGPFEPVRRLGAGGMAETFEAIRRGPAGFEQRVCIKRILPAHESDVAFVEAFLREAKTSAALRHGNIVQVLDFGVADGSHYLALELIDGLDLRALLKGDDKGAATLDVELVTLVALDVALALSYAHAGDAQRASVVHRDISPSNVLVSRAGELKLGDFGIAKAAGAQPLTATGMIKGKIPYLPPEYLETGHFGPEGDLFALGVMLFELWTGQRPFDGENELDTIRRIASGTRPHITDLRKDTPQQLATAIERLLAADPKVRTSSAEALLHELPVISVAAARRKLATLVAARLAASEKPSAPINVALDPTELASKPPPSSAPSAVTRTAQGAEHARSRFPLIALVVAALIAGSSLVFALLRASGTPETLPPPAPPLPFDALAKTSKDNDHKKPERAEPQDAPVDQASSKPDEDVRAELRVVVIPFGEVWIDGKRHGNAPVQVRLSPGNHEIAAGDGRPHQTKTLHLSRGERQNVVFRLDDPPR